MLAIKVSFQPLSSLIEFTPVRLPPVCPSPSHQLERQEYLIRSDLSARLLANVRRIDIFLVTTIKISLKDSCCLASKHPQSDREMGRPERITAGLAASPIQRGTRDPGVSGDTESLSSFSVRWILVDRQRARIGVDGSHLESIPAAEFQAWL